MRVTAQLTDVESGYQLWSARYDRDAADVFALQDAISAAVVEAVKAKLSPGDRQVRVRPQVANLEAYRHYLMGRHLRFTMNDFAAAMKPFAEAVRLDPTYAPAWVALSEVMILATFYGLVAPDQAYASAKEPLAKAAAGQGDSAELLYVEGLMAFGERRWSECGEAMRRALAVEPEYAPALCWSGILLTILGRGSEADEDLRHARESDPLAPYPYAMSGIACQISRRMAEAEGLFDQALAFEPENMLALWGGGVARVSLGRVAEGVAMLERCVTPSRRGAFIHGALGWALAVAGRADEARKVLSEIHARPPGAPAIVSEAWVLSVLGEKDAAFRVLERAEAERQPALALTGMPGFDTLRGDPRFAALVAKMGLPGA
jgi:Flp pilus assembly protein TadD